MSYKYEDLRPFVFTEEGSKKLLKVRDKIKYWLKESGAFQLGNAIGVVTGDSWESMALVDYLVELGEIKEIPRECAGQHRTFVQS